MSFKSRYRLMLGPLGKKQTCSKREIKNMKITQRVRKILSHYESDNPGSKTNLARILMTGKLAGTGKMVILPVDQGWEHGPARSFAPNPPAYDPHYFFKLAIDAGLNAYAAPLGQLEAGADTFAGSVPMILKLNNANSHATSKDQAITASVDDALRLGCAAVGFTMYPGSDEQFEMIEEIREIALEAKSCGLAVVIWSYPRGGNISKEGETAIDVTAYAAHMAAQLGAHIIKVKPPTSFIEQPEAKKIYEAHKIDISSLSTRISHVLQSAFNGRRLVVFSGGAAKETEDIYNEIRQLRDGGASGSIIGRNSFQRSKEEALKLLSNVISIYQGKF
jgi:class I fructose-bisphosphate aldolase